MSELTGLLGKIKLENIMASLIYGEDKEKKIFENYGKEIDNSYIEIFEKLESLYSEADRGDDKLFDAVVGFAALHDDIYFEAGVLVGFQLFKSLEQGYQKHSQGDIQSILEKYRVHDNLVR